MKRLLIAFTAVAVLAVASATSAFADGSTTNRNDRLLSGNFAVLLVVEGITADDKTIIGGFKSFSFDDQHSKIVLKNGYIATDDLWQWRKNIEDGLIDRRSGSIIILDQDDTTEVAGYNFYEGWPCKWYVPDFDSDQSGMAVEKIEIAVEKVERA